MANLAERIDPVRGYNFKVQLDGVTVAGFREVSGLSFTTDVVEYAKGTDQDSASAQAARHP